MAQTPQTQALRNETQDAQLLALKVPPHSVEAEQSLLGGLLLDNQAFDRVADIAASTATSSS
jgi:replicative DNA helicase